MAVIIDTINAEGLHKAIMTAVKSGKFDKWELSVQDNTEFITLASGPSKKKAFLKPVVVTSEKKLKLAFFAPGKTVKRAVYAEYHAAFIQALIIGFSAQFKYVSAGGKATTIDKFTFED